ncbi:putative cytochrome P450 [Mycolicibacterium hassiacum DSM 44199]|uniref:Steroid C26-monooxygenase n=1 Tax=Mycolicibacterium hassiacum (strain DSM 44199 / CIP 105218 / JCM 12690 / 3849) TaxID=1122247 RepID=K5BIH8_MYCHD|nr:cytochrome P450 [Mycolicibacterium hassiacum]EKF21389.1 putative cytochrome P450 [Mycolicibacterium hassiacum DSM 44199]MBX5485112.1 cytochrome P450 [Mycolicibacterium hassiacum]MDA4087154.1 cytochrome P450 [Mycolicibacterium hassiacum DSM 44199]VCT91411.1 Methyl-branched lipid omega-hydroxylase [Mycolicibacterium hassiacum DSM 44199]
MTATETSELEFRSLIDMQWWQDRPEERSALYTRLREAGKPVFVRTNRPDAPEPRGFWAVGTHADIVDISRRPTEFSSAAGTQIFDQTPQMREYRGSIIDMDDPEHMRLRKIVSRGFTPRSLAELRGLVEETTAEILDEMPRSGECDFVSSFAVLLPLRIIDNLLGISREHEKFILQVTNVVLGASDPEYVPDQTVAGIEKAVAENSEKLIDLLKSIAEDRIRNPKDDVISKLVTSDEENLTPQELAKFFILLVGAGNETTRNAFTHGLYLFTHHPDQRDRLLADYENIVPTAIEEIVRYASPVIHMRRTVTADGVALASGTHTFKKGDKVVMWYGAANRDPAVFRDPEEFDITRTPNNHVGFGGPGPHFCLGAHLARLELTVAFKMLYDRYPDIVSVGEPVRLRSNFVNGIKHLKAKYTA